MIKLSAIRFFKMSLIGLFFPFISQAVENPDPQIVSKETWMIIKNSNNDLGFTQELSKNKFITIYFYPFREICGNEVPQEIYKEFQSNSSFEKTGFHFLIDTCGQIYEGSDINKSLQHAGKFWLNSDGSKINGSENNLAIMLSGPRDKKSTTEQIAKTIWLIDSLSKSYTIKQVYNVDKLVKEAQSCDMTYVALKSLNITLTQSQFESFNDIKSFLPIELTNQKNLICKNY